MIAYVLTDGEYSDYHILGVTLDKETADQYAELHGCEVEEYDTDKISEWSKKAVWYVKTRKCSDGDYIYKETVVRICDDMDESRSFYNVLQEYSGDFIGAYYDEKFYMYVVANTAEQAKKIFHDKVAERKAKEAGI